MSSDEPVAFSSSVEGLRRALGDRLDERAHRRFEELGIPMRGKVLPTYPRDAWTRVSLYAGEVLFPTLDPVAQRVALGRRFVRAYAETLVGRALVAAMRVLGPRRAMARLERNFRTGNNFSRAVIRDRPDGGLEVDIFNTPYPEWYEGMLLEALLLTGAREAAVKPLKVSAPELTTYQIDFR